MDYTTIDKIVNDFQYAYMSRIADTGHDASGKLALSQKHILKFDGRYFTVTLLLQDYWYYLENGRKAGKFPPPNKIREWIKVKPILPRQMKNGKLPTQEQLAYLIGRKISKVGTPATHVLKDTLTSFDLVGKVYNEFVRLWKEEQVNQLLNDVK